MIFQQLIQDLDTKTVIRSYPPITEEDIKACLAYAKEVIEKEEKKPFIEDQSMKAAPRRRYTDEDIDAFLEEDKIPEELFEEVQNQLSALYGS